jgi:putative membrane protein
LTQVGGDLIGARLLVFYSVPGPLSAASVIVDTLIQAATQLLFACIGLLVLLLLGVDEALAGIVAMGLAIAALLLIGFFLAQRRGGQRILRWALGWLIGGLRWDVLGTIDAVYRYLTMIYAGRSDIACSTVVHMAGWLIGVAEVLIVFVFLGNPIGIAQAVVIESLMHAIRGAAFPVPSALGVQEGGLILLCDIFDIPPEQAIALSLVRRAADVVLGVPSLLAWQALEWKQLRPSVAGRSPD